MFLYQSHLAVTFSSKKKKQQQQILKIFDWRWFDFKLWLAACHISFPNVDVSSISPSLERRANARIVSFKTVYGSEFTLSTQ